MRVFAQVLLVAFTFFLSPANAATSWPAWKAELQAAAAEKAKGINDLATRFRDKRCAIVKDDAFRRECQNEYSAKIGKRTIEKVILEKMISAIDLKPSDRDATIKVLEPLYKELDTGTTTEIEELNKKFPEPQQAAELETK